MWWLLVLWSLRRSMRHRRDMAGELRLLPDGTWRWRKDGGAVRLTDWIAHPWICVLYLRSCEDARCNILLLPRDSLDCAAHRRLRALLRVRFRGSPQ